MRAEIMAYYAKHVPPNPRAVGGEQSDAHLLNQFIAEKNDSAFAALVERYGRLVLGVCRRILRHEQDAEDAFQATFLVLARRASAIRKQNSVGCWLHGAAYRIAQKAKTNRTRRKVRETPLDKDPEARPTSDWMVWELRSLLDEEINRLPSHFRRPFVLCYLQGKTNEEAARELGCPSGTVASRLGRARERLRHRLQRRGLAVPATLVTIALGGYATPAAISAALADSVVRAARMFARADTTAVTIAPQAVSLAENFLRTLVVTRLKMTVALIVGSVFIVASAILLLPRLGIHFPGDWRAGSLPGAKAAPISDEQRIQGTWLPSSVEFDGKPLPGEQVGIVFVGNEFHFVWQGETAITARVTLDPTTQPKSLDLHHANGAVWPGIYALDGDEMQLCYSTDPTTRPKDFSPEPGKPKISYRLRRLPAKQAPGS